MFRNTAVLTIFAFALRSPLGAQVDRLTYQIANGQYAVITGGVGQPEHLTIPGEIDGYPVIAIADSAFRASGRIYPPYLKSVVLPDSLTTIGKEAFFQQSQMTMVTLGNRLLRIDERAFQDCDGLTSLVLPPSLEQIGPYSFADCDHLQTVYFNSTLTQVGDSVFKHSSNLENVILGPDTDLDSLSFLFRETSVVTFSLSEDNSRYVVLEGVLLSADAEQLIRFPPGRSGHYAVPETVIGIRDLAFYGSGELTSVALPEGLKSIGIGAFYECPRLTGVSLPSSVDTILSWAFAFCPMLESIRIPAAVSHLEEFTFFKCSRLSEVELQEGLEVIGASAFGKCSALKEIILPPSVTALGANAFGEILFGLDLYFQGNAPMLETDAFFDTEAAFHYLPQTSGWDTLETAHAMTIWQPSLAPAPDGLVLFPGTLALRISGGGDYETTIESCPDLATGEWKATGTVLLENGLASFEDDQDGGETRFYRVRWATESTALK